MFADMWYLLTFRWNLIGLPTTDPLKIADHYVLVHFDPSYIDDKKKAKKYLLEVIGGRKMKKLFPAEIVITEAFIPERLRHKISVMANERTTGLFRRLMDFIEVDNSVGIHIRKDHFESLQKKKWCSKDILSLHTRRFGTNEAFHVDTTSIYISLANYVLNKNDKWKKKVPERCSQCEEGLYELSYDGSCHCCGAVPSVVSKLLKKEIGFNTIGAVAPTNDRRVYDIALKSKFKDAFNSSFYERVKIRDMSEEDSCEESEEDDEW